jgi:hypothetical protein
VPATVSAYTHGCITHPHGMASHNRIAVLSRHFTSAPTASHMDFEPEELQRFLTHDNWELRKAIFQFLKVQMPRS